MKMTVGSTPITAQPSSTAPAHRDNDEVSTPDEEEINRNLIALQ